jgi:hypothetical protein
LLSKHKGFSIRTLSAFSVAPHRNKPKITPMPEPTEMQKFSHELKEAAEHGGEPLKRISLAISILAVLVAMVTVLGHRSSTEAILMQSRASDLWNEYQAKKIRMDNLSVTLDQLALTTPQSASGAAKTEEYKAHIAKWQTELAEEQKQAHEFESEAALAEARLSRYELGEALLQIAVVLSSITLFTSNRTYFMLGITLGVIGILITASGLLIH